jgi:sulfur dioxygenase
VDEPLGRIAAARLLPMSELKNQLSQLPQGPPADHGLPCRHSFGSGDGAVARGRVHALADMRGGMLMWQQMGLPVVRDSGP